MSQLYDQDADDQETVVFTHAEIEGIAGQPLDGDLYAVWEDTPLSIYDQPSASPFRPGSVAAEAWAEPPTIGIFDNGQPNYAYDPEPEPAYQYAQHRAPRPAAQRRSIAVIGIALVALTAAVVALLVPRSSPARVKLNTVRTPTTVAPAPVPTTVASISPGPSTAPSPTTAPQTLTTAAPLPAAAPSAFPTSNGGTASNTSGAANVPVYYGGGGGPGGNKVPTVVDGVVMPHPGQAPTAAQVRAAQTIPYQCPATANCGGINWAAIDALAGEGWGK